jgi:hypothetical protein
VSKVPDKQRDLTLEDIVPEDPPDPKQESDSAKAEAALIEARTKEKRASMGLFGAVWGDHDHAPIAVVAIFLFLVLALMGIIVLFDNTFVSSYFEVLKALALAALGYFGGLFTAKKSGQ